MREASGFAWTREDWMTGGSPWEKTLLPVTPKKNPRPGCGASQCGGSRLGNVNVRGWGGTAGGDNRSMGRLRTGVSAPHLPSITGMKSTREPGSQNQHPNIHQVEPARKVEPPCNGEDRGGEMMPSVHYTSVTVSP